MQIAWFSVPSGFTDNFNRADGALGNNWVLEDSTAYSISGNKVVINVGTNTTFQTRFARRPSTEAVENQKASIEVTKIGASLGYETLAVRMHATNDTGYILFINDSSTTISLARVINGVVTIVENATQSTGFSDGDTIRMNLQVSGTGSTVSLVYSVERWTGSAWSYTVTERTYNDTHVDRITSAGVAGFSDELGAGEYSFDNFTFNAI